jgi:hypothetical protein
MISRPRVALIERQFTKAAAWSLAAALLGRESFMLIPRAGLQSFSV